MVRNANRSASPSLYVKTFRTCVPAPSSLRQRGMYPCSRAKCNRAAIHPRFRPRGGGRVPLVAETNDKSRKGGLRKAGFKLCQFQHDAKNDCIRCMRCPCVKLTISRNRQFLDLHKRTLCVHVTLKTQCSEPTISQCMVLPVFGYSHT